MDYQHTGRIVKVAHDRSYAFVKPNHGMHNAFITTRFVGNLQAGDCIEYAAIEGDKGPRVTRLRVIA